MFISSKFWRMTLHLTYIVGLMSLILGLIYPLAITFVGNVIFPEQAQGSLIKDIDGNVKGSRLIGQAFYNTDLFQSRPSANSYDGANSGAFNLATTDPELKNLIRARRQYWQNKRYLVGAPLVPVPFDLLTASASGLDPHISLSAALFQVPMVAHATKLTPDELVTIIKFQHVDSLLGSIPYVNVLELNMAVLSYIEKKSKLPTDNELPSVEFSDLLSPEDAAELQNKINENNMELRRRNREYPRGQTPPELLKEKNNQ